MNATKLTLIVLAAAAIMFGGCSNDNRVLSPGADFQSEAGINSLNRTGSDSDSKFDNNESAPGQERFTILAKVMMLDVESGCWYLQADDGKNYTPVSPKDLVLESGLKLKAEGYIDEKIQLFCGNGPAFVIENYEILSKSGQRDSEGATDAGSPATNDGMGVNSLEGFVSVTKDGCLILNTTDKDEYVLEHDTDVVLEKGDHIAVTGYVSALPTYTCYDAPVFYAETVSISDGSKGTDQPKNEIASITDDDDERYAVPTEDRPQEENPMDREREEKKKIEAEGRSGKTPQDEAVPEMPSDDGDNESFDRPSDERGSQDDLMDREREEKKKIEAEGRSGKTPQDEAAPEMPSDNGDNESFDRPSDERGSQDDLMDREREEKKKIEAEGRSGKTPQDEAAPEMPSDNGDNESFDRPSDERGSQDDLMDREREEKKKIEAEGRSGKTPQDEAAPEMPSDNGDDESFDRSSDDRYSQDDLTDQQLEERKKNQEAEENGEEKGDDGP